MVGPPPPAVLALFDSLAHERGYRQAHVVRRSLRWAGLSLDWLLPYEFAEFVMPEYRIYRRVEK